MHRSIFKTQYVQLNFVVNWTCVAKLVNFYFPSQVVAPPLATHATVATASVPRRGHFPRDTTGTGSSGSWSWNRCHHRCRTPKLWWRCRWTGVELTKRRPQPSLAPFCDRDWRIWLRSDGTSRPDPLPVQAEVNRIDSNRRCDSLWTLFLGKW